MGPPFWCKGIKRVEPRALDLPTRYVGGAALGETKVSKFVEIGLGIGPIGPSRIGLEV